VLEVISSADRSGCNQDQIGPRSGNSANAKPDKETGLEKVAAKQNKTQGEGTYIRAHGGQGRGPEKVAVKQWFTKLNYLVSP
jgi:hypothetical protein